MQPVTRTVTIDALPGDVWEVLTDVEGCPAWASSMKRLERRENGPLRSGSQVKVSPKGMPGAVWTVTEYTPPHSYTWVTRVVPGLRLTGGHVVDAHGDGAAATLSLLASGPVGTLLSPLLRLLFRRNTRLATDGLKRHCEARR